MSARPKHPPTVCPWCGATITQIGRRRVYCDRSCRQRAYENRAALQRLAVDDGPGRRGDRVVERVVTAPHPRRADGWRAALNELADQLADGRIGWWHAEQLRAALARVHEQMQAAAGTQATAAPAVALAVTFRAPTTPRHAPAPLVDEHPAAGPVDPADVRAALESRLRGGPLLASLTQLAHDLGHPVDTVRQALLDLEHLGVATAHRPRTAVPVDELSPHDPTELRHHRPSWR